MESIEFFQVFIIIIILIMTLFYIYFRSLTFSSAAAAAAAADTDMPPLEEKYDVFISFRGEDTRLTFTSHLHKALLGKKIETYIDYRLETGDDIEPALLEAIEKSKIALVIFSKDYASSEWCLKELVHILGRKKSHGQIVISIFYNINPLDVRTQQGTYALEDHPLKGSRGEVANWRGALEEASYMLGLHYSSETGKTEADFVEEVVQDVLTKLNRESSSDLKGLVGIEKKIEKIESLLCLGSPGVCFVGIWGMGGIGKTTLAEAVFHKLSSEFEASCFLANVREKSEQTGGLSRLLEELVRKILKDENMKIDTLSIGQTSIRDRLRRTKALIVLDDVNASNQQEVLVGDHDRFRDGSRIIITARDKGLLEQKVDNDKIYEVEGLSFDKALELFHSHAFRNKSPTTDYTELSRKVVDYVNGNPLALKVMGSLFHRCKSKQQWEVQWKKVKRVPIKDIQKVLRVSYDGLDDDEKEIFLDIACFHKGRERNDVERMLDGCDFFGETGINDLIDMSLISISKEGWSKGKIEMHDLVQQMGRAIAQEQRNRLFIAEDVYQVLTNDQRDVPVQAIFFDLAKIEKLNLEHANFEKMYQLRWLRVHSSYNFGNYRSIGSSGLPNSLRYLDWREYPLNSLPSKFSAQNLVVLEMSYSQVVGQLWNEDQSPVNLKWINLSFSKHLTEVSDLSRSPKIEHINLNGCENLVEIPLYFQHLGELTYLELGGCKNLTNLPEMPCNLEFLNLCRTGIKELPSSVWSHKKISHLDIRDCEHLKSLPRNSCKLKLSGSFSLNGCKSLCEFWELPKDTTVLYLSGTMVKEVPPSIGNLVALRKLDLGDCNYLEVVPDCLFCLTSLQELNLSGTEIKSLPASIKQAAQLSCLFLTCCMSLQSLPELPPLLQRLEADYCTSLKTVSSSSTALTQGWEEYIFYQGLHEKQIFSNCPKLDENARSNIMADAHLRIMRMATAYSKFKEDKFEEADAHLRIMRMTTASSKFKEDKFEEESLRKRSFVGIRCCGNEIPNWFSHKSEGCSIKIALPCDWFSTDFLGFALSLVVAYKDRYATWYMKIRCKYNFKTSNGESHKVEHPLSNLLPKDFFESVDSHVVFVGWYNNVFEEFVEGAQSPTAFCKLVTEVNVDFTVQNRDGHNSLLVEKCGICLLYGKDAEMIKLRAL